MLRCTKIGDRGLTYRCLRASDSPTDLRRRNCTFGQMPANPTNRQPSHRQREVLDLLVSGLTNKEIGFRLGISERGVKHHMTQLFVVFAVSNRAELIALILGRKH
jgi:DNA-binding NarL/FixJ family response regulator